MTDIAKGIKGLEALMAEKLKQQAHEEMQKEKAKRDLINKRERDISEYEARVLALCKEYPEACKVSASRLRAKANRAIDIAAGRAKDFSGAK